MLGHQIVHLYYIFFLCCMAWWIETTSWSSWYSWRGQKREAIDEEQKKSEDVLSHFHNIIFPLVDIWTRFIVGHALFICSKERMAIKNIGGPHVEQRCSNRCHFFPLYNHAVFVYLLGGKQKGLWPRALN